MTQEKIKKQIRIFKIISFIFMPVISVIVNFVLATIRRRIPLDEQLAEKRILLDTPDDNGIELTILHKAIIKKPAPCLIYFQGSAFFMVEAPHQRKLVMEYAKRTDAIVIDVAYRLPPKFSYPTPLEDCDLATKWIFDNAEYLNIDPDRIAVAGDSAGGALAATLALLRRDRNEKQFCHQMLIYPVTELTLSTSSLLNIKEDPLWNSVINKVMWALYLQDENKIRQEYAAPMNAHHFDNLPDAYVEVCEFDPLRGEGKRYAQVLRDAGNKVEEHFVEDAPHSYDLFPNSDKAQKFIDKRVTTLNKVFWE